MPPTLKHTVRSTKLKVVAVAAAGLLVSPAAAFALATYPAQPSRISRTGANAVPKCTTLAFSTTAPLDAKAVLRLRRLDNGHLVGGTAEVESSTRGATCEQADTASGSAPPTRPALGICRCRPSSSLAATLARRHLGDGSPSSHEVLIEYGWCETCARVVDKTAEPAGSIAPQRAPTFNPVGIDKEPGTAAGVALPCGALSMTISRAHARKQGDARNRSRPVSSQSRLWSQNPPQS